MKLIEKYSLETGLKIGEQFLLEKFFPLPFEKYITIQTSSGQAAKNYPYYGEVLSLIKKQLEVNGIEVVVLGGKDDQQLPGCHNLNGQTSLHQSNYILKRSLLHISNDSWTAHQAGYLKIPLIALYGSTTVKNHAPFSFDEEKTVFLESHRNGKNPSYQIQENPQTISFIPPELIANNIFKLLSINNAYSHKSLFFGFLYNQSIIEVVPNCVLHPSIQVQNPIVVRMDYEFNEDLLFQNLQLRKCLIVSNKQFNLNIINQFKGNVFGVRIEIDESFDVNWIKVLSKMGINYLFYSLEKNPEKLSALRLKFFDICTIDGLEFTKFENFKEGVNIYTNNLVKDLESLNFKTNKFVVSKDKVYLSKAHLDNDESTPSFDKNSGIVINSEEFWKELNHFYIYN